MERAPAIVLFDDRCGFCTSGASPPTPPRRSRGGATADDAWPSPLASLGRAPRNARAGLAHGRQH